MELLASILVAGAPNLVGFILPPFVELLNKDVKNDYERFIVALLTCGVVACLLDWNQIASGKPDQALLTAGIIFTECTTIFKLYFANSWLRGVIQNKLNSQGEDGVETVRSSEQGGVQ